MRTNSIWRRISARLLCAALALALLPTAAVSADTQFKGYVGFGEGFDGSYSGLTGSNWMAGVPNDRYLYEINIPGTHDSGMRDAYYEGTWGGTGLSYALTQSLTIRQQLDAGVRRFDFRLTDEKPNDGKSYANTASDPLLFICHGGYETVLGIEIDLRYYANHSSDTRMRLKLAMDDIRNFLLAHPTETVTVQLKREFGNDDVVYQRVKSYLDTLAAAQNTSVQKPLIYTENGNPILTKVPRLGDVRGQIVIVNSSGTAARNKMGYGLAADLGNAQSSTTIGDRTFQYENHWDLGSDEKLDQLISFYWPDENKQQLPRDLTTHLTWGYNCLSSSNEHVTEGLDSPKDVAQTYNANLSSWCGSYVGKYFGWLDTDFVTADLAGKIWKTNFPSDLRYSDIVLYSREHSGKSDCYRTMTGGTYTLPDYPYAVSAGRQFLGWEVNGTAYAPGESITVSGSTTVTARWRYTVSFDMKGHGTAPAAQNIVLGGTVTEPARPAATGWDFGGWYTDSSCTNAYLFSTAVTDSLTLFAKWTAHPYTIRFVNDNGTELQSGAVPYGATPSYSGATPTKAATAQYTYTFDKWSPAIAAVTGNQTYKATYKQTTRNYTVTWKNADGSILKTNTVAYGATPSYSGATPTKAAADGRLYTFAGWSPAIAAVTGDQTYTATFDSLAGTVYYVETTAVYMADGSYFDLDACYDANGEVYRLPSGCAIDALGTTVLADDASNAVTVDLAGGAAVNVAPDGAGTVIAMGEKELFADAGTTVLIAPVGAVSLNHGTENQIDYSPNGAYITYSGVPGGFWYVAIKPYDNLSAEQKSALKSLGLRQTTP